ncbi:MAG: carbohydrate ABC transporter substrate-binding protein [Oscillospiraceae bacterium]|nr:carbohydrate ABC transporter substrate-binding protein [Oscillospiraceae bacterium]
MKKTVKKSMAFALAVFLVLSAALMGCNNTGDGPGDTSGDNRREEAIVLRYASWAEDALTEALVAKFESLHENITVEIVEIDQNSWEQGLFNLATTGDLPDVFWTFDLASATANEWTMDITQLYDNDPYTQYISEDMATAGVYSGVRYGVAIHQFPYVAFLNKTIFDLANVQMPSYNWTVDDLEKIARSLTSPADKIVGVSEPTEIFRNSFCYAQTEDLYTLGFNPETEEFDMHYYVQGITEAAQWNAENFTASMTAEEKEAAYGDAGIWMPDTGKLAVQLDWFWTAKGLKSDSYVNQGMEWVIYPVPTNSGRVVTVLDFAAVAATTEHPEEAYELLKFMTFGAEGWEVKCDWSIFMNQELGSLPTTTDPAVWDMVKEACPGDDFAALFDRLQYDAAPELYKCMPGYNAWWGWTFEQDIWGKLERGEVSADDLEIQMETKMKEFYDAAMQRINARSEG